jgi:small conductance mechanosensitive channel
MEEIINKLAGWANEIDLFHIFITILIGAIVYQCAGPLVGWITRLAADKTRKNESKSERKKRLKTLADLFTMAAKILVIITVIYTILEGLNINVTPLLASAGVAGVALGFGAQNIIKDSLAGFFIILENQYRVGDYIEVDGVGIPQNTSGGTVEKLSIRSTVLRDRDGDVHFIPNGSIVQVVNKTLGFSKVHFTFAVDTKTDTEKLIQIINDTGQQMSKEKKWQDKIINPPHFSEVGNIGKEGFNVTVNGITEPAAQWEVSSEFRRRLLVKMRQEGIETVGTIE